MILKKIETYNDLPKYGEYVLVNGVDNKTYGVRGWHVCEMNDLEDGMDFNEKGEFFWLTENGTSIDNVTHWCELPKINKIDLKELEKRVDDLLLNETKESLTTWLLEQRNGKK